MSSKMIIRSCGSSVRTLIHRHLRPAVAVRNIPTETPESLYSWHYLLPSSFVPQTVNPGSGFSCNATGYTVAEEAAHGQRKFEAAEKKSFDEERIRKDDDDDFDSDDSETDWPASDIDEDDGDDSYEDDDHLEIDND